MPSRKRAGLELVLAERRAAAHREPGERGGAALDAQRNRKRQQLSKEQLALFEALWKANDPEEERLRAGGRARAGRAGGTLSFYELSCLSCSHRSRTIRRNTSASFGSVLGSIGGTVCFQNTRKDARFPRSAGT
jgi:hypothetical protein